MEVQNPYNHQNPVSDPERFVGREELLENIDYNLSLSLADNPMFINMGITGKEGSGKTSLTNIVEQKSRNLGLF